MISRYPYLNSRTPKIPCCNFFPPSTCGGDWWSDFGGHLASSKDQPTAISLPVPRSFRVTHHISLKTRFLYSCYLDKLACTACPDLGRLAWESNTLSLPRATDTITPAMRWLKDFLSNTTASSSAEESLIFPCGLLPQTFWELQHVCLYFARGGRKRREKQSPNPNGYI